MAKFLSARSGVRRQVFTAAAGLAFALATGLANPSAPAQDEENRRMVAMMLSAQPKTRAIAFTLGQSWVNTGGDRGRARYRAVLWTAWQRGQREFAAAVREGSAEAGLFRANLENWRALGTDALAAVQGTLEESSARLASLDDRYEQARLELLEVEQRLTTALDAAARIASGGNALIDVERELAALEGRPEPTENLKAKLAATPDGRAVLAAEPELLRVRRLRDAHFEATMFNHEQTWAPTPSREFANLLNARRQTLGLGPLRLERRLSTACATHAREMQSLGYFAHESPSPGRRTPGERAKLAEFGGSFEGENLFQSDRPQDTRRVFRSWWASDQHRYVLFAGRPDALGLDPGGGTHWALMTGRSNAEATAN